MTSKVSQMAVMSNVEGEPTVTVHGQPASFDRLDYRVIQEFSGNIRVDAA